MNKGVIATIVILIVVIIILIIKLFAGGFIDPRGKVSQENQENLNLILNGYKTCVENNDVECSCLYLYEEYCEQNRERGRLDLENGEFERFVLAYGNNPIIIMKQVNEYEVDQDGMITEFIIYNVHSPSDDNWGIPVRFIKVDGTWKIIEIG